MKTPKARRITTTPGVCNGEPRITGTRVPVSSIVARFRAGESTAAVAAELGVTLADVDAALRHWMRTHGSEP